MSGLIINPVGRKLLKLAEAEAKRVTCMDERELKLYDSYAEAMREHQTTFDARHRFDSRILSEGFVLTVNLLPEWERLNRDEEEALKKLQSARDEYFRYKREHQ